MKSLKKILIFLIISLLIYFVLFKIVQFDKKMMKIMYPLKYSEYVEKYANKYEIDPYMVYAIIKAESNFDKDAKSTTNAIGLMQIMEETALETANKMNMNVSVEDLYEPDINIDIGLRYFTYLLSKYDNNYGLSIVAYNAGMGNVDKWIKDGTIEEDGSNLENIPFKETNNYVRRILRDYEIYKELYKT